MIKTCRAINKWLYMYKMNQESAYFLAIAINSNKFDVNSFKA
jgi:hypothetical protein